MYVYLTVLLPASNMEDECGEVCDREGLGERWTCTRPANHGGPHAAHGAEDYALAAWDDDRETD